MLFLWYFITLFASSSLIKLIPRISFEQQIFDKHKEKESAYIDSIWKFENSHTINLKITIKHGEFLAAFELYSKFSWFLWK